MHKGVHAVIFTDCINYGAAWSRAAGAYRIATELRNMGLRVQVIDFFSMLTLENLDLAKSLIAKFVGSDTLFVGFSSTFFNRSLALYRGAILENNVQKAYNQSAYTANYCISQDQVMEMIGFIKDINPTTDIVFGGTKASNLDAPGADVICVGYGEKHITDYVNFRLHKNLFFKGRRNKHNQLILDYNKTADGFNFNESKIIWDKSDCIQLNETLPFEVSRGCIFKCKFCSFVLNGRSKFDYIKDTEVLKAELLYNYENYGTTRYIFSDDTYNDSTVKLELINQVVQSLPFKLEFGTYGRLDLIAAHPEQADLLQENGLKAVFFGIESLNYESAKSVGKGMKTEKLVDTLYWLREKWGNDIITNSGFIFGLPHDTMKTMETWAERLLDHRFPLHSMEFSPLVIMNLSKLSKDSPSDFDLDPGKFGYELNNPNDHKDWVNTRYGTSYSAVNELGHKVFKYASESGRMRYAAQTAMVVANVEITYDQMLRHSKIGTLKNLGLFNKMTSLYFDYLRSLFAVEVE